MTEKTTPLLADRLEAEHNAEADLPNGNDHGMAQRILDTLTAAGYVLVKPPEPSRITDDGAEFSDGSASGCVLVGAGSGSLLLLTLRRWTSEYRSFGATAAADVAEQAADRLEREHAEKANEKSKRDRLIEVLELVTRESVEKVANAFMSVGILSAEGVEALVNFDFSEGISATADALLAEVVDQ